MKFTNKLATITIYIKN